MSESSTRVTGTGGRRTARVLSLDGGGVRGLLPALVLQALEERTGRGVSDLFDLIAGTSTGGILALGLTKRGPDGAAQFSARELVAMYEHQSTEIFRRSALHRVLSLGQLAGPKYPARPLERLLTRYFGETRLSEAIKPVLVPAYDIERREAVFFKSHQAVLDAGQDVPMRAVARATSAAPSYFPPATVELPGGGTYALVDGGVVADTPAMCAYVEARRLFPGADDVLVVSLGTGERTRPIPRRAARRWGLLRWAEPLIGVLFDGAGDAVDYQLRELCERDPAVRRYYRLQTELTTASDDLDDVRPANIRALRDQAERLLADRREDIDDLARTLMQLADPPA